MAARHRDEDCVASTSKQNADYDGAGLPVLRKVPDHKGVQLWTEIDSSRAIARHAFSPVDGTPLSDGCARMNDDMACPIFDGSRVGMLKIEGFARPMCDPARKIWSHHPRRRPS